MAGEVTIPPYHDLHVAVMGHELPPQQGSGWLEPASDPQWGVFRWTNGRATVRLYCVPGPQVLCLRAGVPVAQLTKRFIVQVNGRTVWRGLLQPGVQHLRIPLPPALVPGDSLTVSLLSWTHVPAEWGAGPDRRKLGVLVQRVWVESAGPSAFQPRALQPRWRDYIDRIGAGWHERNVLGTRSWLFWFAMALGFFAMLLAAIPLRLLRVLGFGPREMRGGVRPTAQSVTWARPAPLRDPRALKHWFNVLADRHRVGIWNLGKLSDLRVRRSWLRVAPNAGGRVAVLGRGAAPAAELLRLHFGVVPIVLDDDLGGARAARNASEGLLRPITGELNHLPLRTGSIDLLDVAEEIRSENDCSGLWREAARVLAPNGRLVIRALSRDRRWTWHDLRHRLSEGRLPGSAGDHLHLSHSVDALRDELEREGLSIAHVTRTHAFFSLLLDEHVTLFQWPRLWRRFPGLSRGLAALARRFEALIHFAEEPWLWAGQSHSFVLEVRRKS